MKPGISITKAMRERQVVEAIQDSYKQGRLIPFVGNGLSMCVPGCPSWEGWVDALEQDLDTAHRSTFRNFRGDNLERLELFVRLAGDRGFELVRERVEGMIVKMEAHAKAKGSFCHEKLVRNFGRLYTTNYDHLLERACDKQGIRPFSICSDAPRKSERHLWCRQNSVSDSPRKPAKPTVQIVKFHGDYNDYESMVVTESDYYKRLRDVDAKDILLMRDLVLYDILFLGYSITDFDLKYILHQMGSLSREIGPDFMLRRSSLRLFLTSTVHEDAEAQYLLRTYNVSSSSICDYCDGEYRQGCFIFDQKGQKNPDDGGMVRLNSLSDLWELADGSYGSKKVWPEKWQKVFKTAPCAVKARSRPALRRLRSVVLEACYRSFLQKIIPKDRS